MNRFTLGVVLASMAYGSFAQTGSPPQVVALPDTLTVRMYPDGKVRGHQLDFAKITGTGTNITALVTMHGPGRNGCRVQAHPANGTFDRATLVLTLKIALDDKATCPTSYEVARGHDGKFSGHYINTTAGQKGVLRPE